MHFKVITSVRNAAAWIERCMCSVMQQTHADWEHVIVDDASTDSTLARALTLRGYERNVRFRQTIIGQVHHQPSHLMNQCFAIDSCKPDEDDIIVVLDGDDWLADENVLARLDAIYTERNCLLTYGTPVLFRGGSLLEPCYPLRPYTGQVCTTGAFRAMPWAATHLRTFKYRLWKRIDQQRSFYLRNGQMVWCCVDFATMFPMLEMARERIFHVEHSMMVYNTVNPASFHNRMRREKILEVDAELRAQPKYDRVVF